MPKVSDEYTRNKRNAILDAANRLRAGKPLHKINMKDVVRETGFSQGGVYRYFANIEEIWLELSRRYERDIAFRAFFEALYAQPLPPQEATRRILEFLGTEVRQALESGYAKLAFEFNSMYISQPELIDKEQMERQQAHSAREGYGYFFAELLHYWQQCEQNGTVKPRQPLSSVLLFVQIALDGLIRDATMDLYLAGDGQEDASAIGNLESLLDTLYVSLIHLLGAEPKDGQEREGDLG